MKDYCIVRDHTGLFRMQNDQMYESHGDRVGDRDGESVGDRVGLSVLIESVCNIFEKSRVNRKSMETRHFLR